MRLKLLGQIFVAFFIYLIVVQFYSGLISVPSEGDSIVYHIPIAEAIVDGRIINPGLFPGSPFLKYSPASSELLLAPLALFDIPLNIYNVVGVAVLFFAARFVGRRAGLSRDFSIIFAVTICSLNGIVRWMNTQIIDIWLLVFFLFSLGLLMKPKKSLKYFLLLGLSMGMLCGTKFTGPIFAFILFVFYINNLWNMLSIKRVLTFMIPFILLGLPWYFRNYLLTGNPIYPQPLFFLPGGGKEFAILNVQVWRIFSAYPRGFFYTINAYIAEFGIWTLALFINIFYLIVAKIKNNKFDENFIKLFSIGFLIFIVYLFLPSAMEEHITVSVFRYSYSAFVLFILCIFTLAQKYKREEILSIIAISNIFILGFPIFYYPKLVFIYIPIILGVIYWKDIKRTVIGNR